MKKFNFAMMLMTLFMNFQIDTNKSTSLPHTPTRPHTCSPSPFTAKPSSRTCLSRVLYLAIVAATRSKAPSKVAKASTS